MDTDTDTDLKLTGFSRKLRIAVLLRRFVTTGGAERYAVEVTRRLAKEHEVHVFCQEWEPQLVTNITIHKVPRPIQPFAFVNQLIFSYFTRRALLGSTYFFDIIHTHERVTQFDVLTLHCPCYRSFISNQKGLWNKVRIWASIVTSPRDLAYLWLEKRQFAHKKDRQFIAVSENIKKDVQANYGSPDESFSLAYPGVDLAQFGQEVATNKTRESLRAKIGISKDDVVILFVGTEFRRKGLGALLSAYALIDRKNTKLVVAGGGGGKEKIYSQMASNLGVAEDVVFLGLVRDPASVYGLADIFVLPTLSDPSPMAPIEAMASGVATIMSSARYAGSAEHIRDGGAIILDDPQDPREIARAIDHLRQDKGARNELAQKGRQVTEALTWDRTTRNTLQAYMTVLAKRGSSSCVFHDN